MPPDAFTRLDSRPAAGLVLAGGRSRRFGGEKAVAVLAGRPLLLWTTDRLRATCAPVAVSARPGSGAQALAEREGLAVLHDAAGDPHGPLAGIRAGLAWAAGIGARSLAVSPCDAPLLTADVFARLIQAAGTGAALARTRDGPQPLCAVWPVSALTVITQALSGGAHPATWRVLEALNAVPVDFDASAFANLNTPDDLAAVEASIP
jgi:molybdopterin-guanine dinucleotide biosynthesis protein A